MNYIIQPLLMLCAILIIATPFIYIYGLFFTEIIGFWDMVIIEVIALYMGSALVRLKDIK